MTLHVLKQRLTTGLAAGLAGLMVAGASHASPGPLLRCSIESACSLDGSAWACKQPDMHFFLFIEDAGRKVTLIHRDLAQVYQKQDFGSGPIARNGMALSMINVAEDGRSVTISDNSAQMGYVSMTNAQCERAE